MSEKKLVFVCKAYCHSKYTTYTSPTANKLWLWKEAEEKESLLSSQMQRLPTRTPWSFLCPIVTIDTILYLY